MCLHEITIKYKPNDTIRHGWKIFRKVKGGYLSLIYIIDRYERNKNYRANDLVVSTHGDNWYMSGFHYYKHKQDAINEYHLTPNKNTLKIKKVKVKNIVCEGKQISIDKEEIETLIPVGVAKNMMIL